MAGPISGLAGGQQQVSLASLQQGQQQQDNNQVRERDDQQQPAQNRVQPQNAPAAQSVETSADNNNAFNDVDLQNLAAQQLDSSDQNDVRRGSVLDIAV